MEIVLEMGRRRFAGVLNWLDPQPSPTSVDSFAYNLATGNVLVTDDKPRNGECARIIKGVYSDGDVRVNFREFEKMMAASGGAAAPVPNLAKN
ncbi:hypothetical protein LINPERPRIM_LOCUS42096 [Linum perenne]